MSAFADRAAAGELIWTSADNWVNGSDGNMKDTRTSFAYVWYDDARVASSSHDADTDSGSDPVWTSTYHYDGLGRLASVGIADGRPRTVSFASAPGGQVLLRAERSAAAQNPIDQRYFVSGVQVGEITSNGNNDPERIDYAQSLRVRNWTSNPEAAPFRWNTQTGVPEATFGGAGFDPINPLSGGMAGTSGRYAVRDGDTLAGIAAGLWGDASLWYMLAEANGLSGSETLAAGTSLIVPSKVTNIRNNAQTLEVYDPSRALGDLSPTAPRPPKKGNKCGAFGAILLTVVAVAVTAIVAPWATGIIAGNAVAGSAAAIGAAVAGGVIGGVAGSIASQAVGLATGIRDRFSWKSVALAGISGGVGGGLGAAFPGGAALGGALRGAVGSVVSQGIGVATGLSRKFDWAGVAAAGVIGGVIGGAGLESLDVDNSLRNHLSHAGVSAASAIAGAATRSVLTGTSFGDNVMAVLPDVIGSTIGNFVADAATASSRLTARVKAAAAELDPAILDDPKRFAEFRQTYKSARSAIRNLDLGNNPYTNADALADTYGPLLSYAADQQAAGKALAALRTPLETAFVDSNGVQLAALNGGSITVTGSRYGPSGPALGLKLLDSLSIQAGNLGVRLGQAYDNLPLWAQYGVTALGFAVDAAAGPIGFAVRRSVGHFMDQATDAAAGAIGWRFLDKGYSPTQAALGGAGALLVGTLVLAGAVKAKGFLASGGIGRTVARAKDFFNGLPALRRQYNAAVRGLAVNAYDMRRAGHSPEEIARSLHADRRALGVEFKDLTPSSRRAEIYERNLRLYGDKLGPSVDWLRAHGKTWEQIIQSASRPGGKDLGY